MHIGNTVLGIHKIKINKPKINVYLLIFYKCIAK